MRARYGTAENRLDRAAFLLARRQVHGWIHRPGQTQQDDEVRNDSAQDRASHLLRRRDILLLNVERPYQALGKLPRFEMFPDGPVAQLPKEFLQTVRAEARFQIALI